MRSHGSVAASVRHSKEKHPEFFCRVKGCLWRTVKGNGDKSPCRNHPPKDDEMVEFEGSMVRWGDLMSADRKAYFMGGYGF